MHIGLWQKQITEKSSNNFVLFYENVFSNFHFKCEQHKDTTTIKINKILNILTTLSGKKCLH